MKEIKDKLSNRALLLEILENQKALNIKLDKILMPNNIKEEKAVEITHSSQIIQNQEVIDKWSTYSKEKKERFLEMTKKFDPAAYKILISL